MRGNTSLFKNCICMIFLDVRSYLQLELLNITLKAID